MNDKIKNICISVIFLVIIIGMLIINCISEDKEMSISERRRLQQLPEISVDSILSGKTSEDFEEYGADQFAFRDSIRSIKNFVHLNILRQKDTDGYFIKDGVIYKQEYPLKGDLVINVSDHINTISEKYLNETNNVYYSVVPDKSYFLNDDHLKIDYAKLEKILSENIKKAEYIDLFDLLSIDDYYKTDTHWKQENLLKVAKKLSERMEFNVNEEYTVNSKGEFQGVYYGQINLGGQLDELKYITNSDIDQSYVFDIEKNETKGIYNEEALDSLDKYNYFLYGSVPILKITNPVTESQKKLIIFRDSFGSSLAPWLVSGYKEITLVDTRYVSENILQNYIDFNNSDVLFIYSTLLINQSSALK